MSESFVFGFLAGASLVVLLDIAVLLLGGSEE